MRLRRKRTARRDPESQWGHASPRKIEELLIQASEGIVGADRAMDDTLNKGVRSTERGARQRTKQNIGYMTRLLEKALRALEKANQEIGF